MRILSFDVGIKNLAYCLFDTSGQTILDWTVADLCNDKRSCTHEFCDKTASYFKHSDYFCTKHAREFITTNTSYRLPDTRINTDVIMTSAAAKVKAIATSFDIKTNKVPIAEIRQLVCDYIESNLLECVTTRSAKDIDLVEIGRNMDAHFRNRFSVDKLPQPNIVLIENQISPIANRMKTIQGMIAQFFITHFVDSKIPIHFVSSSNKLKEFVDSKTTTTYEERKKMGIAVTNDLLDQHIENKAKWAESFAKHNKKDDLADSYLQALWYTRAVLKD